MGTQQDPRLSLISPVPQAGAAAPPVDRRNPALGQGIASGLTSSLNKGSAPLRNAVAGKPSMPAMPPLPPQLPPVSSFQNPTTIKNPNPGSPPQGPNGFNPTTAPHGWDRSSPGYEEQMWQKNQNKWFDTPGIDWAQSQLGQFQSPWDGEQKGMEIAGTIAQPGAGQQHWNGIRGQANVMTAPEQALAGGYQGGNNAQTAFDRMGPSIPGSMQPQFDAYYDRMKQKAMSDVNAQGAARGVYGSSANLNGSIGAGLDIEANRAKASTDFMLADSQNQMNWLNSYSNAGRAADLSGLQAFDANRSAAQFGLDKTKTFADLAFKAEGMDFDKQKTAADLAFNADDHKLRRLQSGIETGVATDAADQSRLQGATTAARGAQQAFENRVGDVFGDLGDFEGDVMSFLQQNGDQLINGDGSLNSQAIEAMLGQTLDARNTSDRDRERIMRDVTEGLKALTGAKTGKLI